jgi:hypothetical protein
MMGCLPLMVSGSGLVWRAGTWRVGVKFIDCPPFKDSVIASSVVPGGLGNKTVTGAGEGVCDVEGVSGFLDLSRLWREVFLVNKLFRIFGVCATKGIFVLTLVSLVLDLSLCSGFSLSFVLPLAPILLGL